MNIALDFDDMNTTITAPTCLHCKGPIAKRKWESYGQFSNRKYCTRECSFAAASAGAGVNCVHDDPIYGVWQQMKNRCYRPKNKSYAAYGGRGIRVCERWRESFEAFRADIGPRPSPQHSIDRKDNDGDYEPENCRWATRRQQDLNRSTNLRLNANGTTKTLSEWASELRVDKRVIWARIRLLGWTAERALTQPFRVLARRAS